jgi:hypothetical protein
MQNADEQNLQIEQNPQILAAKVLERQVNILTCHQITSSRQLTRVAGNKKQCRK